MNLLPKPKNIEIKEGYLSKCSIKPYNYEIDYRIKKAIEKLPCSSDGAELSINTNGGYSEKYIIVIKEKSIEITSDGLNGIFYAVQTLRQIFKNKNIPCMYIEDEPDFTYRGFYHDVTRGKVPTLNTLKDLIDRLASLKINSLQLYIEHTFEFKEYADTKEKTGYLTADEIRELDRYCTDNFIEFIPSIATFGHLFELLNQDKYRHLAECEDLERKQIFWKDRLEHHTIDPTNPESFELIKSLIDQYIPLFSSDKFNICCDETFDLAHGKHKDMDTGKMYIDFVCKIIEYVKSKGKTVMMWGDILHQYPQQIDRLPKDTILLNWCYDPDPPKEMIEKFKNMGMNQIVCPGTNTWNTFCENPSISLPNIKNMASYAYEYGASGILNTNWGDYGNPCSIELAMCGICYGAQKSWNVSARDDEFFESMDKIIYGFDGAFRHIRELSEVQGNMIWTNFTWIYSNKIYPKHLDAKIPDNDMLLSIINHCKKLIEELNKEQWKNDDIRCELIIAAEAIILMSEILCVQNGIKIERYIDIEEWLNKYRKVWLSKNKESELREIENVFINMNNDF